ncbi:hypothetical protein [Agrobacterium tumefaciens]|uniref:hypothetical protein n=1 Tax=Agrobacterium tumefaciens TaxID=358 RepID=UPI00192E67D3|nr:hypothetical protein [Agrobacterium tumefaciens]
MRPRTHGCRNAFDRSCDIRIKQIPHPDGKTDQTEACNNAALKERRDIDESSHSSVRDGKTNDNARKAAERQRREKK